MAQGMQTLYQDGIYKAMKGITTIEEVFRVAKRADDRTDVRAAIATRPPAGRGDERRNDRKRVATVERRCERLLQRLRRRFQAVGLRQRVAR